MGHSVTNVYFYKDEAGEWRWRAVAANGNNVANSGEGYNNHEDCVNIAHKLFGERHDLDGPVEYITEES